MPRALAALFLFFVAGLPAQETGDALFALRHEGMKDGIAPPAPADRAIAAYEAELKADPSSLEKRAALLRALYFRARYTGASVDQQKAICSRGKAAGENGKAALLKKAGLKDFGKPEAAAAKLRDVPGAAALLFWDSALWGQWALAYGKMAAAREGAAATIRDEAATAILLDSAYEDAGPHRVLGRLHHQTPSIPFVTGWASNKEALRHLQAAVEKGPGSPMNWWFYGELLLDEGKTAEAKAAFEKGLALGLRPDKLTEDTDTRLNIQKLLAGMP
jgi:tetratricopeptide (TPR) repeat protein